MSGVSVTRGLYLIDRYLEIINSNEQNTTISAMRVMNVTSVVSVVMGLFDRSLEIFNISYKKIILVL